MQTTHDDAEGFKPVLSHKDMIRLLEISPSKFYALKRTGVFDALASPVPNKFSGAKVKKWLEGHAWRRGSR